MGMTLAQLRKQNANLRARNALINERKELKKERRQLRYGRAMFFGKTVGKGAWKGAKAVDRFLVPGAYSKKRKSK